MRKIPNHWACGLLLSFSQETSYVSVECRGFPSGPRPDASLLSVALWENVHVSFPFSSLNFLGRFTCPRQPSWAQGCVPGTGPVLTPRPGEWGQGLGEGAVTSAGSAQKTARAQGREGHVKGSWVDVEGEPALGSRGHDILGRKPLKACEPVASFSDRRRLSRTEIWRLTLGVCPHRFSMWSWDGCAGADGPGSSQEHRTALELLESEWYSRSETSSETTPNGPDSAPRVPET